jgi:uncharacterized surface protein with fasciclin (FAS1) repeats
MKKLLLILTITMSLAFLKNTTAQGTIVDVAVGNEFLHVTALKAAGLVGALQAEGPFTVFSTNAALLKLILKR